MSRVEEVALRLAAIHDELATLPEGPSPERFSLLKERDGLREEASTFAVSADQGRSTQTLRDELNALLKRRAELVESRSGYVIIEGETSLFAPSAWVQLSVNAKKAARVDLFDARISRIEDELAARQEPPADNPGM